MTVASIFSPRPTAIRGRSEQGVALLGILLTVAILGVMVYIALTLDQSPPPSPGGSTSANATSTSAPTVGAENQQATVSACEADFATVDTAVSTYRSLNGTDPPAGERWATSAALGGPFLQSWPSDPRHFALVWNGSQLSVVPIKGAASHGSFGSSSPPTGCFEV
jgi:hypothetical protein